MLKLHFGKSSKKIVITDIVFYVKVRYSISILNFSPRETSDSSSNGTPVWSFEIRVVHGSDEIHSLIRKSAIRGQPEKTAPVETLTNGVWAITIKSILESEQDFLLRVTL